MTTLQGPDGTIPDDIKECFKELMSSQLLVGLALGQRPAVPLARWVGFTPNNTFASGLMDDVQDRLGGSSHLTVKGAL